MEAFRILQTFYWFSVISISGENPIWERVMTPSRAVMESENKDLEWWLAPLLPQRRAEVGHWYWHVSLPYFFLSKQCVIASRVPPFLSVTICRAVASESDKTCQGASLSPSPPLSARTSLSLRHLYQIWQFLKLCKKQASWRRGAERLYTDLFANKITARNSPQGTIWLPHIPASITPATTTSFSIYRRSPVHPPIHTLHLVKKENSNQNQANNQQGDGCQHISP